MSRHRLEVGTTSDEVLRRHRWSLTMGKPRQCDLCYCYSSGLAGICMACEGGFVLVAPNCRKDSGVGQIDEHCALFAATATRGMGRIARDVVGGGVVTSGARTRGLVAGLNEYFEGVQVF